MPIARSLCINNPFDELVYDHLYQYQFLCGDAIMIVPVTSAEKSKKCYLPEGKWYDLYSDEMFAGNQEIVKEPRIYEMPLFVRASSVIPMQSITQSTKQKPSDTLFVHIYNGDELNVFEYYEDDGSTMDYGKGDYYKRNITFDPEKKQVVFSPAEGSYEPVFKNIICIFHGFEGVKDLILNGETVPAGDESIKLLDGLRYLEDIYDPGYYKSLREEEKSKSQFIINFINNNEEIRIAWIW
jgi:alpha-glucosidase